ncbi:MAG: hypothetical protein H0W08_22190, partial [Acidobacteria bacterium]|nr:hypothetical protein [Acidobacteriota bacterium]
ATEPKASLPEDISEVLRLLETRTREIRTLIDQGNFASVYVPTMIAKDVALQLADRAAAFPPPLRLRVVEAVSHVVRTAWNLDRLGDIGDRKQLIRSQQEFASAIAQIRALHEGR